MRRTPSLVNHSIKTIYHHHKYLVCKVKEIKCNKYDEIIQKIIRFDNVTKEKSHKKYNPNWPQIPDHSYQILIIGRSGSQKTNALLLNLIYHHPNIDKIYLHAKDSFGVKYQFLINKPVCFIFL